MMRIAGLPMRDVWADRVLRDHGVETRHREGVSAEIGVFAESVELKHWGQNQNYRPYLHLTGELRWIAPAEPLPHGISRVTFSPGHGETVDAFYEFDDEQLVVLARKGYFRTAFAVPEQRITGIEWELPATADVLMLEPSQAAGDAPVVFARVHDIGALQIDLASCGYDLTDYVHDVPRDHDVPRGDAAPTASSAADRSRRSSPDAIDPLFPDANPDEPAAPDQLAEEARSGVLETHLREVETAIDGERDDYRVARGQARDTPENLYLRYVAQTTVNTDPGGTDSARGNRDVGREQDEQVARPQRKPYEPTPDQPAHGVARRAPDPDISDDSRNLGS